MTKAPLVEDSEKDPYPLGAEFEDRIYLASRPFMVRLSNARKASCKLLPTIFPIILFYPVNTPSLG